MLADMLGVAEGTARISKCVPAQPGTEREPCLILSRVPLTGPDKAKGIAETRLFAAYTDSNSRIVAQGFIGLAYGRQNDDGSLSFYPRILGGDANVKHTNESNVTFQQIEDGKVQAEISYATIYISTNEITPAVTFAQLFTLDNNSVIADRESLNQALIDAVFAGGGVGPLKEESIYRNYVAPLQ